MSPHCHAGLWRKQPYLLPYAMAVVLTCCSRRPSLRSLPCSLERRGLWGHQDCQPAEPRAVGTGAPSPHGHRGRPSYPCCSDPGHGTARSHHGWQAALQTPARHSGRPRPKTSREHRQLHMALGEDTAHTGSLPRGCSPRPTRKHSPNQQPVPFAGAPGAALAALPPPSGQLCG